MITTEEIIAAQQLRNEALADYDNVSRHERLDVVAKRIELAFAVVEGWVVEGEQLPDYPTKARLDRLRENEKAARQRAHDLLRKALIERALWGVERPICRKCEVEQGIGYCRCEIAANE